MTLYSRKQGGIVSAAAEIIMLVCIVLLTGWYLTQNNWVRELLIQSESKTEVKVSNYRELRAAFSNPKIQTIQITQDILMEQDTGKQLLISRDLLLSGGGFVFDCRAVNNPGKYERYNHFTGLDEPVISFLEEDGEITQFLDEAYTMVDASVKRYIDRGFTNLMVCFGCTGGQHRSVYSAQHLAEHLHEKFGVKIHLTHREQNIEQIFDATL